MQAATSTDASLSEAVTTPTVTTYASTVPVKAEETTASTEAPASEGGLPQLKTEHWGGQIVWLLIIFAVFYTLMATVFTPRIRKVISTRGSRIAEDLANARANRDEAEAEARQAEAEIAEAHTRARKMASEAVARSNAELAAESAAEDVKLNARLGEADARIRAARDEALGHVTDIAAETAQALVEKLTGKAPTAAALRSALGKV